MVISIIKSLTACPPGLARYRSDLHSNYSLFYPAPGTNMISKLDLRYSQSKRIMFRQDAYWCIQIFGECCLRCNCLQKSLPRHATMPSTYKQERKTKAGHSNQEEMPLNFFEKQRKDKKTISIKVMHCNKYLYICIYRYFFSFVLFFTLLCTKKCFLYRYSPVHAVKCRAIFNDQMIYHNYNE